MNKLFRLLFLAFMLSVLVACGQDASQDTEGDVGNTDDNEQEEVVEETEDVGAAYPLSLTDAIGNELTLEEEPEVLVTLMPSITETVFALGQGDKVVGVSDNDNYPEEVLEIEKVGGMEFNVEVIIALQPDVVFAHGSSVNYAQEAFEQLRDAGVKVFIVEDAAGIDATYDVITTLGQVTGATEEAEQLITEMQDGFAELEEITSAVAEEERANVFFEIDPTPYTAGKNTFLDELLEVINATNAAGELEGWPEIDPEAIIEMNPDVIITTYGDYVDNPIETVMTRDGFDVIDAVANERVYDVNSDEVTRPGPRLVQGARGLAEAVYPELFDEE